MMLAVGQTLKGISITIRYAASVVLAPRRWAEVWRVRLYANSAYLMGNSLVTALLSFMFWTLAARMYSPEQVGLGSALVSATLLLAFLANLGLDFALVRFLSQSGGKGPEMVNGCLTVTGLAGVVVGVIFVTGLPWWSPVLLFLRESFFWGGVFVAFVAFRAMFNLMTPVFVSRRKSQFSLLQGTIAGTIRLIGILVLGHLTITHVVFVSWALASAVALALGVFLVLPRLVPGYRPAPPARNHLNLEMARFSAANYLSTGLWTAPTWVLPIMVINLVGEEANGYFFIAWAIAANVFAIPKAIAHSLFSEGSHREEQLGYNTGRCLKLAVALLLPAMLLALLVGKYLLLMFGREYADAARGLLWVLTISALPLAVNVVYLGVARVKKMARGVLLAPGAVSLMTLVLSYVLLPRVGLMAPGIAWLAANLTVAVLVLPGLVGLVRAGRAGGGPARKHSWRRISKGRARF